MSIFLEPRDTIKFLELYSKLYPNRASFSVPRTLFLLELHFIVGHQVSPLHSI